MLERFRITAFQEREDALPREPFGAGCVLDSRDPAPNLVEPAGGQVVLRERGLDPGKAFLVRVRPGGVDQRRQVRSRHTSLKQGGPLRMEEGTLDPRGTAGEPVGCKRR